MSSSSARSHVVFAAMPTVAPPARAPRPDPRPSAPSWPSGSGPAPSVRPPSRAVAVRRRVVVGALTVAIAGAALGLGFGVGQAGAEIDGPPPAAPVYVVQPGDTLWAIAARLAPEVDTRKAVAELRQAAGGSALTPGQRLAVPAALR